MGYFKCCNFEHCGQSFDTIEQRNQHETFCRVPPPPDPPEADEGAQRRAS